MWGLQNKKCMGLSLAPMIIYIFYLFLIAEEHSTEHLFTVNYVYLMSRVSPNCSCCFYRPIYCSKPNRLPLVSDLYISWHTNMHSSCSLLNLQARYSHTTHPLTGTTYFICAVYYSFNQPRSLPVIHGTSVYLVSMSWIKSKWYKQRWRIPLSRKLEVLISILKNVSTESHLLNFA